MAGPPSPSSQSGSQPRDWLDAAGIALTVVAVAINGYGLVALYSLNRADFYAALVAVGVGLPLGAWPILQYQHRKR